MHGFTIGVA